MTATSNAALRQQDGAKREPLIARITRSLLRYHGGHYICAEYEERRVTATLEGLREDMRRTHQALMRRGLNQDQAAELLATWLAYTVQDMRHEVLRMLRTRVAYDLGMDPLPARERGEKR